ncbi:SDR family NAD(P)-dependent oxidoreductase [Psychromicrobium sp. YIM B11713]|uniref:SDR family NAD(P)-dependent oxidoreductase n=1 Tax=Psychromicrobium sp. YIM B11713 TaxID=3145233 RepID=UPI00374E29B2
MTDTSPRTALIIGASRNLGLGLAREFAQRGWKVVGTVRGASRTGLHDLADTSEGQVAVEEVDITVVESVEQLRERFAEASFDLLFVNAGITDPDKPASEVETEVFTRVMVTNALAPLRVIETLAPLVKPEGTMGVMSSRQGSISMNERGGHEVYRASKSALNQLMRSYDARRDDKRTLLLIHPGWVQTELGGEGAPLTVEQSVPGIVSTLEAHAGDGGLQFRSYADETVAW